MKHVAAVMLGASCLFFATNARVVVFAQARPAPTGMIAGTVTDAVSANPLSGVVVEISPIATPGAAPPPTSARRRQLSDGKGRFAFRGLAGGTYVIRATVGGSTNAPSGFIQSSSGSAITSYLAGGYGQRIAGGVTRPLPIGDGEQMATADIALWPTGVIAGNVLDEMGDPLVEAVVGAVRVTTDGRLTSGPTTRTDDRGAYRLSGLAPGRYLVYVPIMQTLTPAAAAEQAFMRYQELSARNLVGPMPPPNAVGQRVGDTVAGTSSTGWFTSAQPLRVEKTGTLALPTTFYPGSTTFNVDNAVAIKAGEERINLTITVKPERTVPVTGILTFNGAGAPGFFVRLLPTGSADAALFEVARAQTDASGRFTFPAVPLGNYVLESTGGIRAAFQPAPGAVPPPRPTAADWVREPLTVSEDGVSGLMLAFKPGFEVRGRVEFVGSAKAPDAAAMKNVRVVLPGLQRKDRVVEEPPLGVPDAAGALGPIAVSPGRYVIRLMTGPPLPWQLQSVEVEGRDVAEQPIDLTESLSNVVVTFTDRPASVTATVTGNDDNAPVVVMLFPANRALWPDLRAIPGRVLSVPTSRDGRAVFSNVLPGEYLAVAMLESDAETFPDTTVINAIAPMGTSVKVTPNAPITTALTLRRPR